jgi:hypothetical protein
MLSSKLCSFSFGNSVAQTALHVACLWGNVDAVKALISVKANLNAQNNFSGGSPLHCAAAGNPRFVIRIRLLHLYYTDGNKAVSFLFLQRQRRGMQAMCRAVNQGWRRH